MYILFESPKEKARWRDFYTVIMQGTPRVAHDIIRPSPLSTDSGRERRANIFEDIRRWL